MKLEVLISTMHRDDHSLLSEMRIATDAIVVNQCDRNEVETIEHNDHTVKWFSLCERGVGLSRNTAMMRATGDILLFADDDIVYHEDYERMVLGAFDKNPKADVILFNFESLNPDRPEVITKKTHRLHWYNCLKYGACRIAIRREAFLRKNLSFSLLFGGGARHSAGEDNLFITNCIQAGLRVIAHTAVLGTVRQEESSWFRGYDEKYYYDRGALFAAMYGRWAFLLLFLMEVKSLGRKAKLNFAKRFLLECRGARNFGKTCETI